VRTRPDYLPMAPIATRSQRWQATLGMDSRMLVNGENPSYRVACATPPFGPVCSRQPRNRVRLGDRLAITLPSHSFRRVQVGPCGMMQNLFPLSKSVVPAPGA